MERIMNADSNWDHIVEGNVVDGPVDCVCRDEVVQRLNEIETVKVPGPSEVSL